MAGTGLATEPLCPACAGRSRRCRRRPDRHRPVLAIAERRTATGAPGLSNNVTPDSAAHAAEWSVSGNLNEARSGHTATLLRDGKVLVVGGSGLDGALASAELYDPASGTWAATGSMTWARAGHSATLLRDGRVLVVGGNNSGSVHYSAELYDPVSESWTVLDSVSGRISHTATLLRDGDVLVAGSGTAEPFDPASRTWSAAGETIPVPLGEFALPLTGLVLC